MNLGITIARKGDTFEVITTPEVSFSEQRRNFRNLRKELVGKYDEIQLWSSSQGRVKRRSLGSSAEAGDDTSDESDTTEEGQTADAPDKKPTKTDALAKARAAAKAKKSATKSNPLE